MKFDSLPIGQTLFGKIMKMNGFLLHQCETVVRINERNQLRN